MKIAGALKGTPVEARTVSDKEAARIRCYLLLGANDAGSLVGGFLLANLLVAGTLRSEQGLVLLGLFLPIHLCAAALLRAFSGPPLERARRSVLRALQALAIAAGAILFITYMLKAGGQVSRAIFATGLGGAAALMVAGRAALARPMLRLLGGSPYMTVVIRDGVDYRAIGDEVVFTPDELSFSPDTSDPYHYHAFAAAVSKADRVIVACPQGRYARWSSVLKSLNVDGEIFTDVRDGLDIIAIGRFADRRTMVVTTGPLSLRDRILKRAFDLAVAAPALVLLAPAMLAVAAAIRLESRGPSLFRQDRIGRDNRIFRMYKFRSMFVDECDGAGSGGTARGDARVTRVGRFIRRTSIDELPQLLNVLRGDMSVVGPRPHPLSAKAADLLFWEVDPRYRHRHSIKPGLTGLAQVRGFRGNTVEIKDLTNRLHADLEYASEWSLSRDLHIVLRTIAVLRHQDAF